MSDSIVQVKDLWVEFKTDEGTVQAVKGATYDIPRGKTVGLVGESGSGKSVSSLAMMGLIPQPPGIIKQGEILFEGEDLLKKTESEMRKVRGNDISMIFQEPMTSLNPVFTVGDQIGETLRLHQKLNKKEADEKALDLLDKVGIPNPSQRIKSYPHEMSGGQRQRVMIAMAIACEPKLLIADEPTTALDVTIQKQILELLAKLQEDFNMSMLFITHDLALIGDIADDVIVMYKGDIVERGKCSKIFQNANHPYTRGLIACRPPLEHIPQRLPMVSDFMDETGKEKSFDNSKVQDRIIRPLGDSEVLMEMKDIKKHFPIRGGIFGTVKDHVKAVDGVSLNVYKGRTLGLVGESGCGKTTLGRTVLRLIEPTEGQIIYNGEDITNYDKTQMREMRKKMQIIFQDPYASLNPRMTVGSSIMEPMVIHNLGSSRSERQDMAADLMKRVDLEPFHLNRYPHEFSGGQRQRICIARALAVKPDFIICDESVSALDVSVQAQVLNLLLDLQDEFNLTYIFISHDLAVVKFISDELAVMNGGKVVELADSRSIYENPQEDYTKKLLEAIPKGIPKELAGLAERKQ